MALFVYPPVSLSISGGASEATLLQVEQNTQDTVSELQTLNAVDFATEAKQDSQITEAQATNTKLDTLNANDFATEAKQDSQITELQGINSELDSQSATLNTLNARLAGSLVPEEFDYQALTYVSGGNGDGEVQTVTYKLGGAGGTTVATLTLAYDAQNRVTSVTRS